MAFKVYLKNDKGQPLSGYLGFWGPDGLQIEPGLLAVTKEAGATVPDTVRIPGINVHAWEIEGEYYDFIMPAINFQDDNDIILQKKPNIFLIAIGAAAAALGIYIISTTKDK